MMVKGHDGAGTVRRRGLSWPHYLRGSALHEAVQAGPDGSTFVNPASLPASTATAPLQTAPPGNSAAG